LAQLAELFIQIGQHAVSMCGCVCVCLGVNQGGTNRKPLHAETCNLACTDLLTNSDRTPKTRSVWLTLLVKIARRKSGRE